MVAPVPRPAGPAVLRSRREALLGFLTAGLAVWVIPGPAPARTAFGLPPGARKCPNNECGYVYDPAVGDPDAGIAPGTAFADLPDTWMCPECGTEKHLW